MRGAPDLTGVRRRDALCLMGAAGMGATMGAKGAAGAAGSGPGSAVLTRGIPSTGETIPVVGLGTWQAFDVDSSSAARAPLAGVLDAFIWLGGRLVDSSPMYGRSEGVVGDLAAKLGVQPKLFIATKVWTSGAAAGIRQMEESMRKLRSDRIELMQVHNLVDVDAHLATLEGWKRDGRVRYVGVTHYTAGSHETVARLIASKPVDFVQINYSVGERDAERRLLPLAQERGVAVIANRPFAGGDLFRRLRAKPLPAWAAEIDCDSWAQVLLKFVVSHPAITCAIPATSRADHLRDNMKAAYGRLPDGELRGRIATEAG
jgi:diketogulonate reductase-like aldo/keto reductase